MKSMLRRAVVAADVIASIVRSECQARGNCMDSASSLWRMDLVSAIVDRMRREAEEARSMKAASLDRFGEDMP